MQNIDQHPLLNGMKEVSGCPENVPLDNYLRADGTAVITVSELSMIPGCFGFDPAECLCTISKDAAVKMFSILFTNLGDDICAFTKQNPPYSCSRQVPPPFLQRASLAYANAALLYGVMSAFFAQMLYRSAVKDVESAIEGTP